MSADGLDEILGLLRRGMPEIDSSVPLIEQAVRLADLHGNVDLGIRARLQLVKVSIRVGFAEKSLVAFTWILGQYDRDPQKWAKYSRSILWDYKWVANTVPRFAAISQAQIDAMFADMRQRYERKGAGLRAIFGLECRAALRLGNVQRSLELRNQWLSTPRDSLVDCLACELDNEARQLAAFGENEMAIARAEPITSGLRKCQEIPAMTYPFLTLCHLGLGERDRAMELYQTGIGILPRNADASLAYADYIRFLTLVDELPKAIALLEESYEIAMACRVDQFRFHLLLAGALLLKHLAVTGQSKINLRLPPILPGYRDDGAYDAAELATAIGNEARRIALRFDARNGNDHFSRQLDPPEFATQLCMLM